MLTEKKLIELRDDCIPLFQELHSIIQEFVDIGMYYEHGNEEPCIISFYRDAKHISELWRNLGVKTVLSSENHLKGVRWWNCTWSEGQYCPKEALTPEACDRVISIAKRMWDLSGYSYQIQLNGSFVTIDFYGQSPKDEFATLVQSVFGEGGKLDGDVLRTEYNGVPFYLRWGNK